ncbi:MAG: hypothetical protein WBI34_09045 [Tenuifilaceae bacterium]|jgi:hypothetical protein|nr:hypothetical protein [Bacteroidales bacterium]MDI9516710.1 hypothetical protein [Bacteroidota bacterium]NLH56175.1 hypothetical protein [Rikenellaceae bacterium]OQC61006.1 MAG: hypothetical protein BWX49_02454 [Bacteroidetes bacterium ADurb.Bin008]HNV82020.1 hypothetical protein [Tenuifilaceae bacterium]
MKKKFDNIWLGTILAVAATVITMVLIYRYKLPYEYMQTFFKDMWMHLMAPKVISLGVIPNLALFLLFVYTDRYKSAKGVLGVTIIFGIIVFIFKLTA